MGENSKIEWTNHTHNFWIGCQEVSPACDFCYAKTQNNYRGWVKGWGPHGERKMTSATNWRKPFGWNRRARRDGVRAKVFSNSLSDFFDNKVSERWRGAAWGVIEECDWLDWLILTKRPQNIRLMLPENWGEGWPNVWLGATVENQEEADRRIPKLLAIPAAKHFLSCEPLLSPVNLEVIDINGHFEIYPLKGTTEVEDDEGNARPDIPALDWVITGGESGTHARPSETEWFRDIGVQCHSAGIPWFHKQMTKKAAIPSDLQVREFPAPRSAQ